MRRNVAGQACNWPECHARAAHELPIMAGMILRIDDVEFEGSAVATCEEHAPRIARIALEALGETVRRHSARTNLALGGAAWIETFGPEDGG